MEITVEDSGDHGGMIVQMTGEWRRLVGRTVETGGKNGRECGIGEEEEWWELGNEWWGRDNI